LSKQHLNPRGDGGRARRRPPMRAIEYQLENTDTPLPFPVPKGFDVWLPGRHAVRKSLVAIKITALVSHHGLVIHSTYEDLPVAEVLHPRLEAAGANHANIDTVQLPPLGPNGRGIEEWRRRIESDKPLMIVVDTAQTHATSDVHQAQYASTFARVTELMSETHVSALFLDHTLSSLRRNDPPANAVAKVVRNHMRMGYLVAIDPSDGDRTIVACMKWSNGDPYAIPSATFEIRTVTMNLPTASGTWKKEPQPFVEYVGESDLIDADLVEALVSSARVGRPPEKYEACKQDCEQLLVAEKFMPRKDVVEHLKGLGHKPTVLKEVIADICESTELGVGNQKLLSLKHDYIVAAGEELYDPNDEGE
jgi:hypothetical protein